MNIKLQKKVNLLAKVDELINDKSMPPKKYLDRNPEKSLTEEQIEMLSFVLKPGSALKIFS